MITPSTYRNCTVLLLLVLSASGQADDNPHWKKSTCQTCHIEQAPVDGQVNLQAENAEALCAGCHGERGDARPCRHASGVPVGNLEIDAALSGALRDGQVVCTTCHDVVFQCHNASAYGRYENPPFLRDRTSLHSADYCRKCHDSSALAKLNPHDGAAGSPPRPTCMLCHETIPAAGSSGSIEVAFNMQHDVNDTCRGCHVVSPHPRNMFGSSGANEWVHLVVPSGKIKANMETFERDSGTVLPLSREDGKIICSTCHNQHGFLAGGDGAAAAKAPRHRLRAHDICQVCHDK